MIDIICNCICAILLGIIIALLYLTIKQTDKTMGIIIALLYLTIKQTDKTMGKIISFEYNVILIILFMFFYDNLERDKILLILSVNPLSLVIEFIIRYITNKKK